MTAGLHDRQHLENNLAHHASPLVPTNIEHRKYCSLEELSANTFQKRNPISQQAIGVFAQPAQPERRGRPEPEQIENELLPREFAIVEIPKDSQRKDQLIPES